MKKIVDLFSHLFTPQEKNNYRAKTLHLDFLSYYLIFALILTFFFKNISAASNNVLGFATDITNQKLFELTNQEREKNSLPPLKYNEQLSKAAYDKAQDMFKKNYWAHYAPDGKTPWDFILANDYKYEYAGENLAKNFLFSNDVVNAWMKSQTHRENILRKEYNEIGFAEVNGILNGEETTLVVQMFGKPLATNALLSTPQPNISQNKYSEPNVLSKASNKPTLNILPLWLNINLAFILLLIAAFILDMYYAIKLNIFRINSKNLSHLLFLGFILLGIFFLTKGTIL